MSTQVHFGFRMRSENFSEVLKEFETAKARIKTLLIAKQTKYLATTATKLLDSRALLKAGLLPGPKKSAEDPTNADCRYGDLKGSAWDAATSKMTALQAEIRKTQHRNPSVDFEVKFKLYLDPRLGRVIGHVVGENEREALDELLACTSAEPYAYWNNTDEDDGVSKKEWAARGDTWHAAFRGEFGTYFVIECPMPYWFESKKLAVLEQVPSFETRVAELAQERACNEFLQNAEVTDWRSSMSGYFDFSDKLREGDPAILSLVERHRTAVAGVVLPVITPEALYASPEALE